MVSEFQDLRQHLLDVWLNSIQNDSQRLQAIVNRRRWIVSRFDHVTYHFQVTDLKLIEHLRQQYAMLRTVGCRIGLTKSINQIGPGRTQLGLDRVHVRHDADAHPHTSNQTRRVTGLREIALIFFLNLELPVMDTASIGSQRLCFQKRLPLAAIRQALQIGFH